jgi:predicted RNA-binding Zn ribbon-like protein
VIEVASPFKLVAGHVALDLANTLDNRYQPEHTIDLIPTYRDFLRFCQQSEVISPLQANRLAQSPLPEEEVLQQVSELREALERIFVAIARKTQVDPADLDYLTRFVNEAMRYRALEVAGANIQWNWRDLETNAVGPLWPIAQAAADLLVSDHVKLVRECGSETCRWLFLDLSKNHSRRWCDMKLCGNRIKARAHYQRTRAGNKPL